MTAALTDTPTPDQGATERAREIALRIYPNHKSAHHQHLANLILDGLTAAEAKARGAAIEECAQIAHKFGDVEIRDAIRALAAPARSETPK